LHQSTVVCIFNSDFAINYFKVIIIFNSVGNKESLSQKVASEIEDAILTKKIPPGDKLPSELELCNQFGVSRTAVREALCTLSAKGLISVEKGRGIFVSHLSSEHVIKSMHNYLEIKSNKNSPLDVIQARMIIEPAIAEYAATHHTAEDMVKLKQNLDEMRENEDPVEHARLDMKFHYLIAQSSGNTIMPLILNPIHRLMPNIKKKIMDIVPGAKDAALTWHQTIVDSIEECDPKKAYNAMKGHLEVAQAQAEQMIKSMAESESIEEVE
jgi:GntR family transcriptional repressor for pyruvate dehydrogenase complex